MKKRSLLILTLLLSIQASSCFAQEFFYPEFEAHPPFREMECGLWINAIGDMAYKTTGCSIDSVENDGEWLLVLSKDAANPVTYYMAWAYTDDGATGNMVTLKEVVDTASFSILSPHYFADKNHIYLCQGVTCVMSIEGNISIAGSLDRNTFKVFTDYPSYACDKNKCFFCGWEIEGADAKTFRPIDNEHGISCDKNNVYDAVLPMSEEQLVEAKKQLGIKLRR